MATALADVVPISAARSRRAGSHPGSGPTNRSDAALAPHKAPFGGRARLTHVRDALLDAQYRLDLAQRRVAERLATVDDEIAILDEI